MQTTTKQPIIIDMSILDVHDAIIVHQVNTLGKFGRGMAESINKRYPFVKDDYKRFVHNARRPLLGHIHSIDLDNGNTLYHLFAQASIQQRHQPKTNHTRYDALQLAFTAVARIAKTENRVVYAPYGMGAGNAGGDWVYIEHMLQTVADRHDIKLVFCRYTP